MLSIPRDVGFEPHRPVWVPRPRIVRHRPEAWARPAHPADVAQARMFDSLLLGEIAELEELVASMEKRWLRRCERGIDNENRPPVSIVRMRGRVLEAQQLLDALRARFPSGVSGFPPCDGDPLTEIQTDGVHTPVAAASRA